MVFITVMRVVQFADIVAVGWICAGWRGLIRGSEVAVRKTFHVAVCRIGGG